MGQAKQKRLRILADGLAKVLADSGRLVEAGFAIHQQFYMPKDLTSEQVELARECWMMGAHHFFGSVMSMLEDGAEPTETDMRRMSLAYEEMEAFVRHFKRRHNVSDDLYPQEPIGQRN